MSAQVAPSGECLRGRPKGPPDRIVGNTWCRLFLAAYPSGLNLVVVVLRDSVCVCVCTVSLLPAWQTVV